MSTSAARSEASSDYGYGSDDGRDTLDEFEEGMYEAQNTRYEMHGAVDELGTGVDKYQEQRLQATKGKSENLGMPTIPKQLRIREFQDYLPSPPPFPKTKDQAALNHLNSLRVATMKTYQNATKKLTIKHLPTKTSNSTTKKTLPLKLSNLPSFPPESRPPPLLPPVSIPRIAASSAPQALTAQALAELNAMNAAGRRGGGRAELDDGEGDDDDDSDDDSDDETWTTQSTDTCPGLEDQQMMLAVGRCMEEMEELVEGKKVEENRLNSGFDDGGSFPPQPISSFDPKSSELTTSQGLLASTTLQVTKGSGNLYHHNWGDFSLFLPSPSFASTLVSRRPGASFTYSLITSRKEAYQRGAGHATVSTLKSEIFSKNGHGIIAVEARAKVKSGKKGTVHYYLHFDPKDYDVESVRKSLEAVGMKEGKVLRGTGHRRGTTNNIKRWFNSLPPQLQKEVKRIKESSSFNPFFSLSSSPILSSPNIVSSLKFPPSRSLDVKYKQATQVPSKLSTYHEFEQGIINEYFGLGGNGKAIAGIGKILVGGVELKNVSEEVVFTQAALGVFEDLSKLKEVFEQTSGGALQSSEMMSLNLSFPRGFSSRNRHLQHKTTFYQVGEALQLYCRQKLVNGGTVQLNKPFHVGLLTYTSTGTAEFRYTTLVPLQPGISSFFLSASQGWLPVRAGYAIMPFKGMELSILEKPTQRVKKQLDRSQDEYRIRQLFVKWIRMANGHSITRKINPKGTHTDKEGTEKITPEFSIPFTVSFARKLGLSKEREQYLTLKAADTSDSLSLVSDMNRKRKIPTHVKLYLDAEGNFEISFVGYKDGEKFPLDNSTLTPVSVLLLDYIKWKMFSEAVEGRLHIPVDLAHDEVIQKFEAAQLAYKTHKDQAGKADAEEQFKNARFPTEDGLPIWQERQRIHNFDALKDLGEFGIRSVTSKVRWMALGWGDVDLAKPPKIGQTLYVDLNDAGKTRVRGFNRESQLDFEVVGLALWGPEDEKEVIKAVQAAQELYIQQVAESIEEEEEERERKRQKVD